jgi:hypothetical protein
MTMTLIKTKGLFTPMFLGIFVFGNVYALAVVSLVLSGHGARLAGASIFGTTIGDGVAVESWGRCANAAILWGVVIVSSALYAVGCWLMVVIGASIWNWLVGVVTRSGKT